MNSSRTSPACCSIREISYFLRRTSDGNRFVCKILKPERRWTTGEHRHDLGRLPMPLLGNLTCYHKPPSVAGPRRVSHESANCWSQSVVCLPHVGVALSGYIRVYDSLTDHIEDDSRIGTHTNLRGKGRRGCFERKTRRTDHRSLAHGFAEFGGDG